MSEWTTKFPTTPGDYLFYGDYVPSDSTARRPAFHVCQCVKVANGTSCIVGNLFLYPYESYGVFKPLNEEAPDLAQFGLPGAKGE